MLKLLWSGSHFEHASDTHALNNKKKIYDYVKFNDMCMQVHVNNVI